jgi:ribosomal protein S6--L-glutamate ligase
VFLGIEPHFANKGEVFNGAAACIPRLSEDNLDYKVAIMKHLEKLGVKVLNSGQSMRTASNKIETQIILNDEKIKTPKTTLFINEEQLESAVEAIGGKFPVIVKTIFGTHGVGVIRADSMPSLRSIAQQMTKTGVEFMLQEYIEHEESARILVLGDEAIASVIRTIPNGDFRSNAHQGAELKKYEPQQDEIDICVKSAKLIGANFSAVDYIVSGEGENREILVLEVNGSPGFEAMQEVIDFDIADRVIEYIEKELIASTSEQAPKEEKQKDEIVGDIEKASEEEEEVKSEEDTDGNTTEEDASDDKKSSDGKEEKEGKADNEEVIEPEKIKIQNDDFVVVGSVDEIIIKYFNDEKPIKARIDTGAEYSSINGTDIEITDETIAFTFGEYRYRFSLVKNVNIVAANGKEKRPIIRLDIAIDDKVLHNVEFTVNDRGTLKYDALLGRRALSQANVLVNPSTPLSGVNLGDQKDNDGKDTNKGEKEEE